MGYLSEYEECRPPASSGPLGRGIGRPNELRAPPTPYGTSHVAARSKRARRNVTLHFCSQRQVLSVGRALSIEVSACLSFGTTGTRPWPRWKRLPPSSFLSWWVLALSCSKVGGDKRVRQGLILGRRSANRSFRPAYEEVLFGKSTAPAR
jgi:hypothetical protein